ncbi:MAG: carotenoid biosynthesis protein [Bacteroidetes bacterium]|nr:carotenoid biosynthesis protein [Bacteroidota bacterium]
MVTSNIFRHESTILLTAVVLLVYYAIGIHGLLNETTRDCYVQSTTGTLLGTTFFVALFDRTSRRKELILCCLLIAFIALIFEEISVATGIPFGSYTYSHYLGSRLINVPLIIGLNWCYLVYCSAAFCTLLRCYSVWTLLCGATLLVVYDSILEQVASNLQLWYWVDHTVPAQNYITWFVLGVLFHGLLRYTRVEVNNPIAPFVFLLQFIFFGIFVLFVSTSQ